MWLRAAMARFSAPARHPQPRAAVVAAVARVDPDAVGLFAAELAAERLAGDEVDVLQDIGRVVPTLALLHGLGLTAVVAIDDVESIVRVIGRGEPATFEADSATDRLLAIVGDVARVSLLYQNFDATAALIACTIAALGTGAAPVPAVPRTRRVALVDTVVDGAPIAAGSELVLEIGAAGLPFGAGPHECPGRVVAEAIVAGVVDAFVASGLQIDPARTEVDPDGRPTRLIATRVA